MLVLPLCKVSGPEDLMDLLGDLHEVVNWYTFGVYLKVEPWRLEVIQNDYPTSEERRKEALLWWLNNALKKERKWATIVHAHCKSGYASLAQKVALKHGE